MEIQQPSKRVFHLARMIDGRGEVSALCFSRPRAINLRRASWVLSPNRVTCPKCKRIIRAHGEDGSPFVKP
jgi:hypothetical protein